MKDIIHDIKLMLGIKEKQPSLLAIGITWTNNATWIERLIAYKQLDEWTYNN
jgi:hypothetical protein